MSDNKMNAQRLEHLKNVVRADVSRGLYHGAVIKVARGGKLVFDEAIGAHDGEQQRPLDKDSVFSIFSITKAFTNLLTMKAIEEGRFSLTSSISDLIPEFSGHGRERITIYHLLSHQSGIPIIFEVDRSRDGHSFTTRRVIAVQHGRQIFNLAASFQIPETGFEMARSATLTGGDAISVHSMAVSSIGVDVAST